MSELPSCTSRTPAVLLRDAPSSQGSRHRLVFQHVFLCQYFSHYSWAAFLAAPVSETLRHVTSHTCRVGCLTLWRGVTVRTAFPPSWRSPFGQSCPFSKPVFVQKLPTCRRAIEGQNAQNGSSKQIPKPYKNAMVKGLCKKREVSLATWVLWQEESWPENSGLGCIQQLPLLQPPTDLKAVYFFEGWNMVNPKMSC